MHHKIDVIDEERYDIDSKVAKNDKEVWKQSSKHQQFSMCSVSIESNSWLGSFCVKVQCVVCVDKATGNESEDLWDEEQAEEA